MLRERERERERERGREREPDCKIRTDILVNIFTKQFLLMPPCN